VLFFPFRDETRNTSLSRLLKSSVRIHRLSGIRSYRTMKKSVKTGVIFLLLLLQVYLMPDGHFLRPDSVTWARMFYSSWLAYSILSLLYMVEPDRMVRFFWQATFLLYIGTIGSTIVQAPGMTMLLLVVSTPLIATRFLLESGNESAQQEGVI
jgi:hypothetical protein